MDDGELIAGWQVKRLEEVCDIARGGSPRPIKQFITDAEDGVNWIKISDATASTKYIYETKQKIKPEGIQRSRFVKEGDFILSNSMSFGRPYIMKTSGCIHDGWLVLSDREGAFNQDFLYYFLSSPAAYKQFNDKAAGSTVRNLNIDLVKSVEVLFPPLPEQKRIVAILDEAFAGISLAEANAEKNLANARELLESYFNNVFTQKGDGWTLRRLEDICSISSKLIDPREAEYINLPHIGAGNIVSMTGELIEIKTAKEEKLISGKFFFDKEMVLYSKIRPYLMKTCRPDFNGLCSADIYPLSVKPKELERNFLYYLLMSRHFTDYAIAGSARAGMPKVNRNHLFNYQVSIPDLSEQKKISDKLDELFIEKSRLESIYQQKLTALNELKQSILQKAFLGQLTMDK